MIRTLVFYINDGEVQIFSTASGDEPTFTNTFVGKWTRNDSDIERQVIFSYHAAGLYEYLPFCDDLYDYDDNTNNLFILIIYSAYWKITRISIIIIMKLHLYSTLVMAAIFECSVDKNRVYLKP